MNAVGGGFQIEEELLRPIPRSVVATRSTRIGWRIGLNLLLALLCALSYYEISLWWSLPYILILWWAKCYADSRRRLLQTGRACIATVTSRRKITGDESSVYEIIYTYHLRGWVKRTNRITTSQALFEAYPEGRQFSVLIAGEDSYSSTPYFCFTDYAIENAPRRNFLYPESTTDPGPVGTP